MAFHAERLTLTASRSLQWGLLPIYMAAGVAPFLSRLPLPLSVLLALLVCWHGYLFYRREVWLRTPDAVVALRWDSDNHWFMTLGDGREVAVIPGPRTLVVVWLCLLELRPEGGGRTRRVPLLADSCDPASLRRLRVRLRFGGVGEGHSPQS